VEWAREGPGAALADGTLPAGSDVDPAAYDPRIRSLANLPKDSSLSTCFRCHGLKDVLKEGYLPGDGLEEHFALKFPVLGDRPYTPDFRVRTFAYQATHLSSECYLDGPMDCVSCHEPHGQGYWDVNRRPLESPFDDGQCTACHASKAEPLEDHTFHPPESEGSRCVNCHMPYLQHPEVGPGVEFARSDHTIPVPRPAFDDSVGVESACVQCHAERTPAELQRQAEAWWGELEPHRPLVRGMLHRDEAGNRVAAARLLLRPDLNDPLAQFQALARFLTERLPPDVPELEPEVEERLRALTRSPDPDVRALALAALPRPPGAGGPWRWASSAIGLGRRGGPSGVGWRTTGRWRWSPATPGSSRPWGCSTPAPGTTPPRSGSWRGASSSTRSGPWAGSTWGSHGAGPGIRREPPGPTAGPSSSTPTSPWPTSTLATPTSGPAGSRRRRAPTSGPSARIRGWPGATSSSDGR